MDDLLAELRKIEKKIGVLDQKRNALVQQQKSCRDAKATAIQTKLDQCTLNQLRSGTPQWLYNLYWEHPVLAGVIRKAARSRVTLVLDRRTCLKCAKCNRDTWVIVGSKTGSQPCVVCDVCKDAQDRLSAERLEQERDQEARDRQELDTLRAMPYRDYLQSGHWREFRKYALKRAWYI